MGANTGSGDPDAGADFPAVDDAAIRRLPRRNKTRQQTLLNESIVKWCPERGV